MDKVLEIKREKGKIYSPVRGKWLVETPDEKVFINSVRFV